MHLCAMFRTHCGVNLRVVQKRLLDDVIIPNTTQDSPSFQLLPARLGCGVSCQNLSDFGSILPRATLLGVMPGSVPFPALPPPPSWFPGHMNRFAKQLPALLSQTDVVLEIRDSRLPLTSINHNFEGEQWIIFVGFFSPTWPFYLFMACAPFSRTPSRSLTIR